MEPLNGSETMHNTSYFSLFLPCDHPLVVRPSWSHLSLHGLQKVTNADMEAWNEANLVFTQHMFQIFVGNKTRFDVQDKNCCNLFFNFIFRLLLPKVFKSLKTAEC